MKAPNELGAFLIKRTLKADTAGCSSSLARLAVAGDHNQLRHMHPARQIDEIEAQVKAICESCGARSQVGKAPLKESVRIVRERFAFIAPEEIAGAYRLWACGEVQAAGAEMYGGQFNAAQLGKILGAYCEKRRPVVGAYLRQLEQETWEQKKAGHAKAWKDHYENNFEKIIEQLKAKAHSWQAVGAHLYDTALRRGLIRFEPGEARQIYEEALQCARKEAQDAYDEGRKGGKSIFQLRELEKAMADEKGIEERAKEIARKMSVFRKLLSGNQNQKKE